MSQALAIARERMTRFLELALESAGGTVSNLQEEASDLGIEALAVILLNKESMPGYLPREYKLSSDIELFWGWNQNDPANIWLQVTGPEDIGAVAILNQLIEERQWSRNN